ncbi:hypothetical protein KKC67_02185 [Patescibacteria group bacterium]|nr:hypothetical protein [Patescibacteria group bacterium]MBU0879353.1 hypothetical protein [Patescibacteria group bacterium]MBU0880026.1 hypothetical protein [Patescibacteria group bacterium]MBU1062882.1 hypothetical protein [Patescibacteria group bacterium]MBU1783210.1 hypothetical protein [Patescibacteria group bacterium]
MNLIRPEKINLINNPTLTEKWVQEIIANDPSILGLGDLILKDKERIHPKAGRLDLLLQDPDSERRYEVEIQLGKVDESHIIRTIEYWDIEKKRYPQYDHCAVIIAEDITNRFLNVINIFNGTIPLIAIKMEAFKNENDYWLNFTTVLNEVSLGLVEEDEIKEATDRNYWEKRGTTKTVALADELVAMINEFTSGYELKYNKFYVGLAKDGQPDNFVIFRPKKSNTTMEIRLEQTVETDKLIEDASLDLMEYDNKWNRYRIRISKQDLTKNKELIINLLKMAYGKTIKE